MTTNDKYDPNKQTCASWDCKNLARPGYSHCDEHLKAVNDSDELYKNMVSRLVVENRNEDGTYDVKGIVKDVVELLVEKDQACEQRVRGAHMQGWHEGRMAANNPQMVYTFTTGIAHITEKGDNK